MSIDETNAPLLDGDAASIMGILLAISMEHDGDPPGVEAPATPVLAMLEALGHVKQREDGWVATEEGWDAYEEDTRRQQDRL